MHHRISQDAIFFSLSWFFHVNHRQQKRDRQTDRQRGKWRNRERVRKMGERLKKGNARNVAFGGRERVRRKKRIEGSKGRRFERRFSLNLEIHAQAHFPRERPLPAACRCSRILSVCGGPGSVRYPLFPVPQVYNSFAMRRSRTKAGRKVEKFRRGAD